MISPETLRRIKQVEIHTRRLLNGALVGDSRSAVKGSGFEFDQIREYQLGDDIRFIDWKSSVRTNKLLIKQYIEERSRCIIIALDASSSGLYASGARTKYHVMAEVAAVISLVADHGKDSVGLLLFTDTIECFIPPRKGRNHVTHIMQRIFEFQPRGKATCFSAALKKLMSLRRKDTLFIMISDFIETFHDPEQEKLLTALSAKQELMAIRCLDLLEHTLPTVGFLIAEDLESGEHVVIDTRKHSTLNAFLSYRTQEQITQFKRHNISCLDISTTRPFIGDIIRFFRQRMAY
ncbi:DUF58 domain-containing protein [Candidatus Dependentiae bacterium]|nr:DUF58 domain-containing protein [Candidatus Dependentiae bacterium]